MASGQVHEVSTPHRDIELNVPRQAFQYAVTVPTAGLDSRTGLMFCIHGFGGHFNDAYMQKLRPFLADRYNCVTVSVDYFGAECLRNDVLNPAPDFFSKLTELYGMTVTVSASTPMQDILNAILEALAGRGVRELPPEMLFISPGTQYMSFGVLPALDHLQVTHRLLQDYPLNRRRLFVLGTSYGGYIGQMLNKLAPNTFRLVIDNSGFTSPSDALSSIYGLMGGQIKNVRVTSLNERRFSKFPDSPNYFSPAFAQLRELRIPGHYGPSETVLHCYHSRTDTVAPLERKLELIDQLKDLQTCHLTIIDEADLDGHRFKTLAHGMDASLRGLFELSYERWLPSADTAMDVTDFDLATARSFDCGSLIYNIRFHPQTGVEFSAKPL